MGEEDKYEFWGLSLSLKPPKTNLDHHYKPFCNRESHFSTDEQSPKMQKQHKTSMMFPRVNNIYNGVEQKPLVVIDLEEVEVRGSPNSTLSSSATTTAKKVGGFGGERDIISDDDDDGGSGGGGGGDGGGCGRKKLRLSKEQIMVLEQAFREHTTLNTKQKVGLAKQVNLRPRQVEVWFQNRRARTKLKQTEVDCEYLRRYCENLTQENKKLQKEVQELRALKVSPEQSSIHAYHPPTALTMCPSCKNVSLSSSSATTKPPANEMPRCPVDDIHRAVPLNLNKFSLTINNNRIRS